MDLSKQEIEEELAHKREVIKALMRRRRPLELQAAKKGDDTPPEVLNEIADITDQIRIQDEEATRLRTLAVEDEFSAPEADYRLLVAELFDTPTGQPTVVGSARLEIARLRMGLSFERAQELEQKVRAGLARESLTDLDLSHDATDIKTPVYQPILRAFRLDQATTRRVLATQLSSVAVGTLQDIAAYVRIWPDREERSLFLHFLDELEIISITTETRRFITQIVSTISFSNESANSVVDATRYIDTVFDDAVQAFCCVKRDTVNLNEYKTVIADINTEVRDVIRFVENARKESHSLAWYFPKNNQQIRGLETAQQDVNIALKSLLRKSESAKKAIKGAEDLINIIKNIIRVSDRTTYSSITVHTTKIAQSAATIAHIAAEVTNAIVQSLSSSEKTMLAAPPLVIPRKRRHIEDT